MHASLWDWSVLFHYSVIYITNQIKNFMWYVHIYCICYWLCCWLHMFICDGL